MPRQSELTISQRCEEMILYGHQALTHFPKAERHVLSAQIRDCMWMIMRLIVVCDKKYHKKNTLRDLDVEVQLLSELLKLAHELRYLDIEKWLVWAGFNKEIGRMVGGWIKSSA